MTIDPGGRSDDDLFRRLRSLWTRHDPMPPGLVDDVLVALATGDLGIEYAMLTLVESTGASPGVRGPSEAKVVEFSDGDRSILMRVSDLGKDRRRVDGWIAPASSLLVRLEQDHDDFTTVASTEGRFDFADIPAGGTRMWLQPDQLGAPPGASRRGYTTERFEL